MGGGYFPWTGFDHQWTVNSGFGHYYMIAFLSLYSKAFKLKKTNQSLMTDLVRPKIRYYRKALKYQFISAIPGRVGRYQK